MGGVAAIPQAAAATVWVLEQFSIASCNLVLEGAGAL
jgi:hypothetical protein